MPRLIIVLSIYLAAFDVALAKKAKSGVGVTYSGSEEARHYGQQGISLFYVTESGWKAIGTYAATNVKNVVGSGWLGKFEIKSSNFSIYLEKDYRHSDDFQTFVNLGYGSYNAEFNR